MKSIAWILFSFAVAFLLCIIPLPDWAVWYRPEWLVLVLIYWVMVLPKRVNIGLAWILGLILDGLQGTLLGYNALSLTIVAYLTVKLYPNMRLFPIFQQVLAVLGLVVIYEALLWLMQGMVGEFSCYHAEYLLPILTSMILWPWVSVLLHDFRQRCKIG